MSALRFAVFPTAPGPFGIAWGERGIVGIQLPEARAATRKLLEHVRDLDGAVDAGLRARLP